MSFLSGILVSIGEWLLGDIITWVKNYFAQRQQDALNKANAAKAVAELEKQVQGGSDADIAKAGENVLNNSPGPK